MEARRKLPIDRPAILPVPILAKFDQKEEYDRANMWRENFADELAQFYKIWAPSTVEHIRLVDYLTIPYVARWSFGEELAALRDEPVSGGTRTASSPVTYALETVAALLANGFKNIDLLASSRDDFVLAARAASRKRLSKQNIRVFISAQGQDAAIAKPISSEIVAAGFEVFFEDSAMGIGGGVDWRRALTEELERADALIIIVTRHHQLRSFTGFEVGYFLRTNVNRDHYRPVIPLVIRESKRENVPDFFEATQILDNFKSYNIYLDQPLTGQLEPVLDQLDKVRKALSAQ
jgi:hypothetical protein